MELTPDTIPAVGVPMTLQQALVERRSELPPMMQRYLDYKERYPDAVLFFQVGDFYELFFDDAVRVSQAINLTLTSRDKNSSRPIPMCGFPLSVVDSYLDRLVQLGLSVAVVAQAGSGQGVDRNLERFVTPGMRLFTTVESNPEEGVLAAVGLDDTEQTGTFIVCDPQAGVVRVSESIHLDSLAEQLYQAGVHEVVIPSSQSGKAIDRRHRWVADLERRLGKYALKFRIEVAQKADGNTAKNVEPDALTTFHSLSSAGKRAVRQLLAYLDEISLGNFVPIKEISTLIEPGVVVIDSATRRNLELFKNARDGGTVGSLFSYLNHTCTAGGLRLLRKWLLRPLCDLSEIRRRQDAIESLLGSVAEIRRDMGSLPDLDRLTARITLQIATPRDLAAIRDTLISVPRLCQHLSRSIERSERASAKQPGIPGNNLLAEMLGSLEVPQELSDVLQNALTESPPHTLQDGGVIKAGYDPILDEIRTLRSTADSWRENFEKCEREATGIPSLKVKSNNVIGYFIEVSAANISKVPERYIRRQSTVNSDRFSTPDLKQHEDAIIKAVNRQVQRETELFNELKARLLRFVDRLRTVAQGLNTLDALSSLAFIAERDALVRPNIEESKVLLVEGGRHPVISNLLGGRFVPNATEYSATTPICYVLTGPNMGGKSTYLRQTALIVILAQMGSFVPADSATVGLVDKIFARLGASDNLHEGDSTFMVEMREAAHIINSATDRSLVLIDELGRGTATSDGLSLAQAIIEEILIRIKCRTLFATHFYELTNLVNDVQGLGNLSVGSVEENGQVVFTHEIKEGPAPRSYGVEVAKLSGLPERIIERAKFLLNEIEDRPDSISSNQRAPNGGAVVGDGTTAQLSLFSRAGREPKVVYRTNPRMEAIESKLRGTEADTLSPRQALELLYDLCGMIKVLPDSVSGEE